jgi:cytosine/adenosine deaminase-related metal-dependent hydrolase
MSALESVTYTARWIFPVAGPPLSRGSVSVRGGRIEAINEPGVRAADLDFGNSAIVPGFVNPHTHLDLSGARGRIPPTDPQHFTDWLRRVIEYRKSRTNAQIEDDIRQGLAECLNAGTTLLGDISAGGTSWDVLDAAPIRSVVFRELIGISLWTSLDAYFNTNAWLSERPVSATCRGGLSPHAPYSVRKSLFTTCGHLSASRRVPCAVHYAESPAEAELVQHRRGPFADFLHGLNLWEPEAIVDSHDEFLDAVDFGQSTILVHGNYLEETARLPRNGTLIYCPRTHAAFGHAPHPFRKFLARGLRLGLGTDSLASNPDLDILAEARFLHEREPDFPGDALLRSITLSGAEALGWADETGSFEVGKSADFVVVPLPNRDAADPHKLLFAVDAPAGARRTLFRGTWRD